MVRKQRQVHQVKFKNKEYTSILFLQQPDDIISDYSTISDDLAGSLPNKPTDKEHNINTAIMYANMPKV